MIKIIHRFFFSLLLITSFLTGSSGLALSQVSPELQSPEELKNLSVEELMNIEVTSVSRKAEKLTEVASAIQVITREDIHRSAATTLPEALRLASNLQVSQVNSQHWIISARGFNATFSNKLLVLIDGRTVYSPLFAGVYWDVQNVLLEDIERIEIISGPGATLWGANAVNGVINIITRNAKDSGGLYLSGSAGSELKDMVSARYGGNLGSNLSYKIYGQHSDRNPAMLPNGQDNADKPRMTLSGFQLNWDGSERDNMLIQGNMYLGQTGTGTLKSVADGQNITGRWFHGFSDQSDITIQLYYDRTWRRDVPSTISDELSTYDFDFQHHFPAGNRHEILWGAGYRLMNDNSQNATSFVGFVPAARKMDLFSGFIQDEISLVPEKLKFTIGTKVQHNDFSGFDLQPSGRLAWTANEQNTLWAAVSRAVRAPSRIDVDYRLPTFTVPSSSLSIQGIPDFDSEKVVAYESGYRFNPNSQLLVSIAGFYNRYDDVYSIDSLPGTATLLIRNGTRGKSYGAEFSVNAQISSFWKLRGGYTYFHKKMEGKPGSNSLLVALSNLGIDAKNRVVLQSVLDPFRNFQLDLVSRYTSKLPASQFSSQLPSRFNLDARLAYQLKQLEISVAGQNLLDRMHPEFGNVQIVRNIYGKITWRLK